MNPPPVSTARDGSTSTAAPSMLSPWTLLVVWVATLLAARVIEQWSVTLPVCGMRALTGIPCPLCGSTRSLIAWSHLDLTGAIRLNPLTASTWLAMGLWMLVGFLNPRLAQYSTAWLGRNLQRQKSLALLAAASVANWVYVICSLPR